MITPQKEQTEVEKTKANSAMGPPWAQSDDPDLAEKNKYLGPTPSLVSDED